MKSKIREEALHLTQEFVRRYWARDFDWCLGVTGKDFTWIGARGDEYGLPREEFVARLVLLFEELADTHLTQEEFAVVASDATMCVVAGNYLMFTDGNSDQILSVHKRFTMVWQRGRSGLELTHYHSSFPMHLTDGAEIFPARVGETTYQYMQAILRQKMLQKSVSLRDASGTMFIVAINDIAYIEANRQSTIIHCFAESIRINDGFASTLSRVSGDEIVRIHRSYAVNILHVAKVESGGFVELDNGKRLPIPIKRLAAVRNEIETAQRKIAVQ